MVNRSKQVANKSKQMVNKSKKMVNNFLSTFYVRFGHFFHLLGQKNGAILHVKKLESFFKKNKRKNIPGEKSHPCVFGHLILGHFEIWKVGFMTK